jgi:hypothetical protein
MMAAKSAAFRKDNDGLAAMAKNVLHNIRSQGLYSTATPRRWIG